ncbi:MAG TPA: hypothetical protein VNO14_01335 [Blastocatellia bacterium]|nr:hypothetical protein [Blastocatellia bacterium]
MVCLVLCLFGAASKSLALGAAPPGSADGRSDLNSPIALVFSAASIERRMGEEYTFKRLLKPDQVSPSRFYTVPAECYLGRFHTRPSPPGSTTSRSSRLITRGPPAS